MLRALDSLGDTKGGQIAGRVRVHTQANSDGGTMTPMSPCPVENELAKSNLARLRLRPGLRMSAVRIYGIQIVSQELERLADEL